MYKPKEEPVHVILLMHFYLFIFCIGYKYIDPQTGL